LKILILFPKDSEALFNKDSKKTFGGASTQLYNIAKELSTYPDISSVSVIPGTGKIDFPESHLFNLVQLGSSKIGTVSKIYSLLSIINTEKPDVILQRGLTLFSCLLALFCKLKKIKFIFMFAHDREANSRYQKNNKTCLLFPLLIMFSYKLIVQNRFQFEMISKLSSKTVEIKSGYPVTSEFVSHFGNKTALWISRLELWKQPEIVLQLADELLEVKFIIVAPVFERTAEYGKSIVEKIKTFKNIEYISFSSFHYIDEIFQRTSFFINTSTDEGFPNTFIQSAVNSLPIISLNVSPDNFIENNKCGIVCNSDFSILKKAAIKLTTDKKYYQELAKNSFEYAKNYHDIKKVVRELIESFN
jgi:glycosyltransferase involved in cell wall biosynthesis